MTIERELAAVKRLLSRAKAEGDKALIEIWTNRLNKLEAELAPAETTFLVVARNKETNEVVVKEYKAVSAKKAKEDFRDNGYAVRFVSTEETFDADCEAYNAKIEKQVSMRAIMKEVRAQYA